MLRRAVAVGLLVGGLAYGQPTAGLELLAQQQVKESKLEQDVAHLFGTKDPDEELYKLLVDLKDSCDVQKKLIRAREYDKIAKLFEQPAAKMLSYDLLKLDNENRQSVSCIFNGLGVTYAAKVVCKKCQRKEEYKFPAEKAYLRSIALTNHVNPRLNLAFLYKEAFKDRAKALSTVNEALKIDPNNFMAQLFKRKLSLTKPHE